MEQNSDGFVTGCAANKAPSTSPLHKSNLKRPQGVTDGGGSRHKAWYVPLTT